MFLGLRIISLSVLGLAAILSGCGLPKLPLPPLQERLGSESTAAIKEQFALAAQPSTVRASYLGRSVTHTGGVVSYRVIAVGDADKGQLRIEILPEGPATALRLLVVSDGAFTLLIPPEKKAYQGRYKPSLLKRVMGVELSVSEVIALLTGNAAGICGDPTDGRLFSSVEVNDFVLFAKGRSRRCLIGNPGLQFKEIVMSVKGGGQARVTIHSQNSQMASLMQTRHVPGIEILGADNSKLTLTPLLSTIGNEVNADLFSIAVPQSYELTSY